jgi:hypothetical protein
MLNAPKVSVFAERLPAFFPKVICKVMGGDPGEFSHIRKVAIILKVG